MDVANVAEISRPNARQPIRAALGAFVGTTIEWYDFYIFATAASLLFGRLFFPAGDRLVSTLGALGTLAVGFLARPLGAVYFGSLGDRLGRKKSLVVTLLLMGGATVSIGILPTYDRVGLIAPILLVCLRIVQGIAMGGEWGGAVLIAGEHGTEGKKTFYASFPQLGNPAGMILALLAFRWISALPTREMLDWGWRVPFILSAFLMITGLVIRHVVRETPDFEAIRASSAKARFSAIEVLRNNPGLLLLVAGANTISFAAAYLGYVFMLTYTTQYLHYPKTMMLDCLFFATVLQLCIQPVGAWIADQVGTGKFLLVTSCITVFTPFIMYPLVSKGGMLAILVGLSAVILFNAGYYAAIAWFSCSLFPADVRYSAISISYQGCAAVAGGLAPVIGTILAESYPGNWVPLAIAYSSMAAISATCIAVLLIRKSHLVSTGEQRRTLNGG